MVDPARALPGRKEKMRISATHYVLKTPMEGPFPENTKTVVLANGCFCEHMHLPTMRPSLALTTQPSLFALGRLDCTTEPVCSRFPPTAPPAIGRGQRERHLAPPGRRDLHDRRRVRCGLHAKPDVRRVLLGPLRAH